ncbi:hypothetical protein GW750_08700 [bacterium]|nr:hypothetical protein [bacterium]
MQYNKNDTTFINFPGEYDVNGCFIRAIVEKDMLHYMIQMQDKKIAILGNKRAVQHDSMDIADIWYVTDASIQETMEKMEME